MDLTRIPPPQPRLRTSSADQDRCEAHERAIAEIAKSLTDIKSTLGSWTPGKREAGGLVPWSVDFERRMLRIEGQLRRGGVILMLILGALVTDVTKAWIGGFFSKNAQAQVHK